VVQQVVRDPDRGSFINVVVKPMADLEKLDEVLVITSLEPHLSAQQMADLKTSEELKGAEVAADAQRKKAAAEMGERLPGLKDPNAPAAAAPVIDPKTGLPVPVAAAPVVKPIPAKHADRFSPGGVVDSPAGGDGDSAPGADVPPAKPTTPVTTPKAGAARPGITKPGATRPGAQGAGSTKPAKPAGRAH
jgi:rod shape-determining protein MreC